MSIIQLLLPLFLLTSLGWLLRRAPWLGQQWPSGLSDICAKLLFPCLLFNGTYKTGIPDDVPLSALLTFYLPVIILFLLLMIFRRRKTDRATVALSATYSNNVFIGVPLLTRVLGAESLRFAFPIIAFHSLLVFLMYYIASAWHHDNRHGWWRGLLRSVKNPIVLSLLAGLLFNWLHIDLPEFMQASLSMLSGATLPCALLVLGASLAGLRMTQVRSTTIAVIGKIILLPVSVFVFSHYVFDFAPQVSAVMVLMSACPTGINAFPVAHDNGDDATIVSSAILISTLLCTITIPLWVAIVIV